jgi:predicted metal-binding protein
MPKAAPFAKCIRRAKQLGAEGASVISPGNVLCAEWVRLKCQYGCGGYGRCLMCPPYSPTPEQTRRVLEGYAHILIVHCKQWADVDEIVVTLEREIFLDGYYKALAYGSGPCNLCSTCDTGKLCKHPDRARPAMEASGIDVFATARKAGYPIQVVRSRDDDQNYFGLVAIE